MKRPQGKTRNRSKIIREVRESILDASSTLRNLGAEYERVGWMLEDSLMYLDEIGTEDLSLPQAANLLIEVPEREEKVEHNSQ